MEKLITDMSTAVLVVEERIEALLVVEWWTWSVVTIRWVGLVTIGGWD